MIRLNLMILFLFLGAFRGGGGGGGGHRGGGGGGHRGGGGRWRGGGGSHRGGGGGSGGRGGLGSKYSGNRGIIGASHKSSMGARLGKAYAKGEQHKINQIMREARGIKQFKPQGRMERAMQAGQKAMQSMSPTHRGMQAVMKNTKATHEKMALQMQDGKKISSQEYQRQMARAAGTTVSKMSPHMRQTFSQGFSNLVKGRRESDGISLDDIRNMLDRMNFNDKGTHGAERNDDDKDTRDLIAEMYG